VELSEALSSRNSFSNRQRSFVGEIRNVDVLRGTTYFDTYRPLLLVSGSALGAIAAARVLDRRDLIKLMRESARWYGRPTAAATILDTVLDESRRQCDTGCPRRRLN
jgi:hypothetical protein